MSAVGEDTSERYQIVKRLAEGGMAVVDRAVAVGPGGVQRELVVKRIRPRFSQSPRFARMFVDEARIVSQLIHPNIVHIYEFGTIDGDYFLAMEYVPGVDLARLFKKLEEEGDRFPIGIAVFIAVEVCRALDYAHRKRGPDGKPLNIIHRDVSPQNVLISHEGAVKLADFGIAQAAERREQTLDGVIKGKVGYMSPEQLKGEPLDSGSDIFSLAIVLYILLAGRHPFAQSSDGATIEKALLHDWPMPSEVAPDVPSQLDTIVARATAHLRDDRYGTAGEMAEALEGFLFESRLRATASDLAALMRRLYGDEEESSLSPIDIDRTIASELRCMNGDDDDLRRYTLSIPRHDHNGSIPKTATVPMFRLPDRLQKLQGLTPSPAPNQWRGELHDPAEPFDAVVEQSTQPVTSVPWQRSEPPKSMPLEETPTSREIPTSPADAPPVDPPSRPLLRWAVVIVTTLGIIGVTLYIVVSGALSSTPPLDRSLRDVAVTPVVTPPDEAAVAVDAEIQRRTDAITARIDADTSEEAGIVAIHDGGVSEPTSPGVKNRRPPQPLSKGWVRVVTRPHYAEVYIDGRLRGSTPLLTQTRVGRRRIRLVNPQLGRSEHRVVIVSAGNVRETPVSVVVDGF